MYNDSLNPESSLEKFPGGMPGEVSAEQMAKADEWENSMKTEVPEFAGNEFGVANENNEYYGEAKKTETEVGEEYNEGISNAAALINYGLDAAAREKGVEYVVQTIKGFDASGRENPIGDLFSALGIDSPAEKEDVKDDDLAFKDNVDDFREGVNRPSRETSYEGVFKALDDMKELISEVEGADPRYEELRARARAAGKGYFEYAVSSFGTQGLTELFRVLAMQREKSEEKEEKDEIEAKEDEQKDGVLVGEAEEEIRTESLNPEILKKDAA